MKELSIISGKGGTGKTSLAGSFVSLAGNSVITDCDVDAANLSLILNPELKEEHDFIASREAFIHRDKCTECGLCRELCRFGAISEDFHVDPLECEGCGVCYHACPEEAISFDEVVSGQWFLSDTTYGPLVHARLGVAEENSGKLVTMLRQKAGELTQYPKDLVINDGPPGIGCPVIAALGGATAALIITEPTISGIHDLERIFSVCQHFKVHTMVCINRFDLDEENTEQIKDFCRQRSITLAGQIPFERSFTEAVVQGMPVIEYSNGAAARCITETWEQVLHFLD